ncbi:MAG: extracellular solute-binding protein [Anaerolineae bacterium]|nr:extracellular solute-binding protein [Anaerolineae bacterium]
MLKKQALTIILALLLAAMLVACGGTSPTATEIPVQDSATDSTTAEPVEMPVTGEQTPLTVWTFEGESENFTSIIEDFETKHPNIKVEVVDIPESEYGTKVDTALIAGEPPDIGFINDDKWIASGKFLPIGDHLKAEGINIEDYNPGAMTVNCLVEGEAYCIGTFTGALMLFYNKDILDAAGIEYPSATVPLSMDQYAALAEAVTKEGATLADSVWGADTDIGVWWQDRRNFFSEDGRTVDGYLNDEATVHMFEKLIEMREAGAIIQGNSTMAAEGFASQDMLASGQLATSILEADLGIKMLENTDIRWGVAPVPVEQAGDEPWTATWTDAYGVFSEADHPEAAMEFVSYMATEGNNLRVQQGIMPLKNTLGAEWAGESEGRQQAVQVIALARPGILVPGFWDIIGPLWDAYEGDMLEDGRPPQEVLDEYVPILQETLDQAWDTWDSFKE